WFLVDRIQELSVVDLRWKNRVVGIEPHADHVTLHVDTPGGAYRLEANWVIDASGAHTLVREQLGVGMTVSKAIDRWCISDVRFERPAPAERWTWIEAHSNENRAVWRHPMADDVWRLDYQMPPDADPNAVSAREVVEERIRRQFGDDVEFEIVWVGPYAYRSACADAFRIGRVFLAGDAAHVMSPFGARGGNSGIQDADNLVWKLALVLENKAPEGLLDSYASERRFAAQENIRITNRTTRFLSPRSPTERVLREAVIALAREVPFARGFVNTGRLSSPTRYADSPLNVGAAGHSRAGRHVQNVALTLPDGTRGDLVELLLRYDHAVLVFFAFDVARDLAREVARIEEAFPARCLVLRAEANETSRLPVVVDSEHKLAAQLGVTLGEGAAAAIVRPDLHLAGTVEIKTAGDLEAALQVVLGGREPPRARRRR
ncbi:MAG TPA: FAD-dependent monooxygenase, partial [Burkholderiaceae bacterium]|nr:FAD-dependent monooxygenase [Burkholderiaceae bacterium]